MSRAIQDATACREALARLPKLGLRELRQQWSVFYKADASPHLSRELLLRAVANRMQEVALGGLRPERQRQLRQFAQQLNESQERRISRTTMPHSRTSCQSSCIAEVSATGLPTDKVEALLSGLPASFDDKREQVVYEMATCLANSRWVPKGVCDRAVEALGHEGITDVICLMGFYTSVSMTLAFYDVPAGATGMAR